jgi:GTPase
MVEFFFAGQANFALQGGRSSHGRHMSFIDEAKFFVKGGDGGNGCISFRREKFVPKGGPNGGDGGRGGSVLIVAKASLHSLVDFRFQAHFKAERGEHGKGKDMHGRKGRDHTLFVPVGSVIKDAESGRVLADLATDGESFLAARGGDGGMGNPHFASGTNRTPRFATPGKAGEEFWLKIELKLIADVGLVGLPNAGKSTLLSQLSAASPKIAAYPFTTLEPQLGVMGHKLQQPIVLADIPGLVAGAHQGTGLGHTFLRHIERTSLLLHVLDAADPQATDNFEVILNELRLYNEELVQRARILVLNKADLLDREEIDHLEKYFHDLGYRVMTISGLTGDGVPALREVIFEVMMKIREE